MISTSKVTEIFYLIDEFYKEYDSVIDKNSISIENGIKKRNRKPVMSDSEIMTILVLFHLKSYRNLKAFYLEYVCKHMRDDFPKVLSYNRFVERQRGVVQPLGVFMQLYCKGECTGISFLDSTSIKVCHVKREKQNRVFEGFAEKGKGTMGWFYGFKLHIIINDRGEIVDFVITKGNVDDRKPLKDKSFHKKVFGKIYADRGYIGKDLFDMLFIDGIHLVTKLRKNMKKKSMEFYDKVLLRKRSVIETVNDVLKNQCYVEHTRHRSFDNFIVNMLAGLIAYSFLPTKPSIKINQMLPNMGVA